MKQTRTIVQWAELLEKGKRLRFSEAAARSVKSFVKDFCDFKVLANYKDGLVILEKAPIRL